MKYPYNVTIDGVFYPTGTEISPQPFPEIAPLPVKDEPEAVTPDEPEQLVFEEMSISALREYVAEHGIEPESLRSKESIIAAIKANQ